MEEKNQQSDNQVPAILSIRDRVIEALKTVYDPEIPVDIYELGLIYEVTVGDDGSTHILMTLTAPSCPAAGMLPTEVETKALGVEGVTTVNVELTFDPPWEMSMMSDEAKLELGFM